MNEARSRTPWLDEEEEAGLVRAAKQGNRHAFLALVDHYHRPLYRLAFALARRRDDAAEITRESFARAWAGIHAFPEGKRFFPWLLRMARNLSVAQARRRAGEPTAAADLSPVATQEERDDAANEYRILDAFRSLRPDEQMALALRVVEGLRYGAIAEWLDQPVGVTLTRLSTARGFLLAKNEERAEGGEAKP
ncbi:MAG TPA: RNA polymerase sigma factor [Candidatus Eisenbacteria bacterium]|nr:RNA polymerase sigma factor [Candidatus Eisenbacteria bacterium]